MNKKFYITIFCLCIILIFYYIYLYIKPSDYLYPACFKECEIFRISNINTNYTLLTNSMYYKEYRKICYVNLTELINDVFICNISFLDANKYINLYLWLTPISIICIIFIIIYINSNVEKYKYNIIIFLIFLTLKNLFYIISLLIQKSLHSVFYTKFYKSIEAGYLLFIYLCLSCFIVSIDIVYKNLKNIYIIGYDDILKKYYIYILLYTTFIVEFIMYYNNNYVHFNYYFEIEIDYTKYVSNYDSLEVFLNKYIPTIIIISSIHYIYIITYIKLKYKKNNNNYKYINQYFNMYIIIFVIFVFCRFIEILSWYFPQNNVIYYLSFLNIFQGVIICFIILYFNKTIDNILNPKLKIEQNNLHCLDDCTSNNISNSTDSDHVSYLKYVNTCCTCCCSIFITCINCGDSVD